MHLSRKAFSLLVTIAVIALGAVAHLLTNGWYVPYLVAIAAVAVLASRVGGLRSRLTVQEATALGVELHESQPCD